jgi:recombination protein RecR
MNSLPQPLKKAIDFFEKLPGIGPKTAKRLGFFLLRLPQDDLADFASSLADLKKKSLYCEICSNLTEESICAICQDNERDPHVITIVEDVLDLLSMEMGDKYKGVYHVLHGRIDPLNYVGPDDIKSQELFRRVEKNADITEIILATNPTMEGEATAMYIKKKLVEIKEKNGTSFRITRIAYGLPIGADLEYADYMTLQKAMEGRRDL